jgi:hypothetical protein
LPKKFVKILTYIRPHLKLLLKKKNNDNNNNSKRVIEPYFVNKMGGSYSMNNIIVPTSG